MVGGPGVIPPVSPSGESMKKRELDILTPRGQRTRMQEQDAMTKYLSKNPSLYIVETPKTTDAKVDGFFVDMGTDTIVGVYEVKCREMTWDQLEKYDSWLLTKRKIEHGRSMSALLRVPYFGLLYLVPDDIVCVWQITNASGKYEFKFKTERTKTRRSVNGGVAFRENAFLELKDISEVVK